MTRVPRRPRRLERMFFIVGVRPSVRVLRTLTMVCWKCSNPAAHRLTEVKNRFTLFFIPIIPLSTKRVLDCLLCGASQELSQEQVDSILAIPEQHNSGAVRFSTDRGPASPPGR